MFDRDRWQEIFDTLKKNKMRTFFTAFGVFWGIFMLMVLLGSGEGLRKGVSSGMGDMATNSMFMWTQRTTMPFKGFPRGRFYNFNNGDTRAMIDNIAGIEYIAPRIQGYSEEGNNNVVRGERTGAFTIQGDYPAYNLIDPMNVDRGRFVNDNDIAQNRKVAVIGRRVQEEMFKTEENPIGEYLRINGVYFQIVGVVSSRKNDNEAIRDNQSIYLPFTTVQKTYNYGDIVGWYSLTAKKGYSVSDIETQAKALMRKRHSIDPADTRAVGSFNVENEFLKMTRLFAGIAGLIWIVGIGTLLAGVIGISNIMLVVIKERTKEIGIQRAIGARPWTIVSQIITESVFLTTFAGYLGLVAGVGVIELVNNVMKKMGDSAGMFKDPSVSFHVAVSALIILIIAGVIAGIIPARKAVKIKPIEALRYE
ncbi:MAG TPA: multidrug ABC transporter ATP-binding protein [Bacteroidales bacterium]|nr:MAG: multidrug ABC transporter ATP-binding protein [Bacteroidetes bacterium GWE2_42_24]OFY32726.1 MAG: multidrug ABC transporter ATP-binding protein [Bacteroidetes bacterium GWF2_43_11]HAQ66052.1 multidrug ABC transporter ATP-binding protein [Bacteroidales bacterium]HBZ65252.1 multidrug ABC transporter ATP-binding protein [Bacteroidales bacterium]